MQTAVEHLPDDMVKISVEVDAHDIDHAFKHALTDMAKDMRLPGFRKGKAPVAVIRQRMGEEAVRDEALRSHINGWWSRACSAAGVEGIGQPEINWPEPPAEGSAFSFTGVVAVPPKAELPKKLELAAVRPSVDTDEAVIDSEIERIRAAGATFEVLEIAVEQGHQVLVDLNGAVDGNAIKDAQATDLLVEAGAGRLLDELDEAILGMRAGEERQVAMTLPATQKPKKLAGREAIFTITVKEVRARVMPELDDEFAKQMAGFDTLAELRDDLKTAREQTAKTEAEGQFRRNVLQDLGGQAVVGVPDQMIRRRVDDRLQNMARSLGQQGIQLEQYLQMMGRDIRSLIVEMMPEAEREVREELALDAYAERVKAAVTDDELRAFVSEQAAAEDETEEVVQRIMDDAAMREDVRRDLRLRNALDHAVAAAKEISAEQAEARSAARSPQEVAATNAPAEGAPDDSDAPEQEN